MSKTLLQSRQSKRNSVSSNFNFEKFMVKRPPSYLKEDFPQISSQENMQLVKNVESGKIGGTTEIIELEITKIYKRVQGQQMRLRRRGANSFQSNNTVDYRQQFQKAQKVYESLIIVADEQPNSRVISPRQEEKKELQLRNLNVRILLKVKDQLDLRKSLKQPQINQPSIFDSGLLPEHKPIKKRKKTKKLSLFNQSMDQKQWNQNQQFQVNLTSSQEGILTLNKSSQYKLNRSCKDQIYNSISKFNPYHNLASLDNPDVQFQPKCDFSKMNKRELTDKLSSIYTRQHLNKRQNSYQEILFRSTNANSQNQSNEKLSRGNLFASSIQTLKMPKKRYMVQERPQNVYTDDKH